MAKRKHQHLQPAETAGAVASLFQFLEEPGTPTPAPHSIEGEATSFWGPTGGVQVEAERRGAGDFFAAMV